MEHSLKNIYENSRKIANINCPFDPDDEKFKYFSDGELSGIFKALKVCDNIYKKFISNMGEKKGIDRKKQNNV